MGLMGISKDILLEVFYLLKVCDLLAVELTCSSLRNAVASRSLWLFQLQRLVDIACAPRLPSYVVVDQLGCFEIRSLVVAAYQQLKIYKSSHFEEYMRSNGSKHIVLLTTTPENNQSSDNGTRNKLFYRLSPVANLLFVADINCLQVYDVPRNSCTWKHPLLKENGNLRLLGFAFDGRSDTSLLTCIATFNAVANSLILELFCFERLEGQDRVDIRRMVQDASQRGSDNAIRMYNICMGGDFVALYVTSAQTRSIILWNWKTEELWDIILTEDACVFDLQIMRDHLFYVVYSKSTGRRLELMSLRQFVEPAPLVYFADVKRPFYELKNLYPSILGTMRLVMYDLSHYGSSKAIKLILVTENMFYVGLRAHVASHFEIMLDQADSGVRASGTILYTRCVRPILCDPSVPSNIIAPSSSGCVINNCFCKTCDNRNGYLLGLDDEGEFFSVDYGGPMQACGMTVEYDAGALVQAKLDQDPKRVEIYCLI